MKSITRRPVMWRWSAIPVAAALLGGWSVLACGFAGPVSSTSPTATVATRTAPPTPQPTMSHEPTAPLRTPIEGTQPPEALLTAGADAVAGSLGTYCWAGTCADVPQIPPKSTLPTLNASGQPLSLSLTDGASLYGWRASYASASNGDATILGEGGGDYDPYSSASGPPELSAVTFAAPPAGDWVVMLFVTFRDGDAGYAWHVVVS